MSKDLLVLADEYAAATATFARALASKDEADSMSPIAREAGDKRAVLAEALAALDTAQQEPVNAMLVEALERIADPRNKHFAGDAQVVAIAALTAAKQAQPPAPGDAAREYMTGYSGGREWAGATNQALVERAPSDDPLQGAVDWFLQADGECFCVATVQRTLRIGYNRAKRLCDIAKERAAHGIKQGGQHD